MRREIIGQSEVVKKMMKMIEKVAATKTNILVIGESGTGKELVARMIHDSGPLQGKPFVPVNCGAIPENLIESEMFGHKRGSFTGAVSGKDGLFQVANNGTLFLDEVGELPLAMQVKLLRAIQEKTIRKVGGNDDIRVDVRIIAATNRDLEAAVAAGTFREDLYYRLNVILIKTPPLRERGGDLPILMDHFLAKIGAKFKKEFKEFEPEARRAIEAHTWPGNVRELENVMERAITLSVGDRITFASLPPNVQAALRTQEHNSSKPAHERSLGSDEIRIPAPDFGSGTVDLDEILGIVERRYLEAALAHSGGVKKKAAQILGITFRSIRYRLQKYGLDSEGGEE